MKKIHNNYPLNQSCLFKLKSKRKLAEFKTVKPDIRVTDSNICLQV